VARSRDHFCSGKATMRCVYVGELCVTVNCINILSVAQQCLYGKFVSSATINRREIFV
jgi:hypothetical protein